MKTIINRINQMEKITVKILNSTGSDREIADRCRTTVGMEGGSSVVPKSYMKRLYLSEHSPIRLKTFLIRIENCPSYVATHLARHHTGVEKFIQSQRTDRTKKKTPRSDLPQDAPVTMELHINAQALINISRKRLCCLADPATQYVWGLVVKELSDWNEELARCCVPECVYRGFCPEMKSCGRTKTRSYELALKLYREGNYE